MLPLREDYPTYTPPAWVKKTVYQLLESLRAEHIAGLSAVVLTESTQIRKGKTRRVAGRKYAMKDCLGFYHPRWRGEPPAVFLIVDNLVRGKSPWHWRLPFTRDVALAALLFHEVGHHLNVTIGPLAGGEEASADAWKRRLWRMHFRRKYWYLRPVGKPLRFVMIRVLRSLRSTAHARRSAAKFRT